MVYLSTYIRETIETECPAGDGFTHWICLREESDTHDISRNCTLFNVLRTIVTRKYCTNCSFDHFMSSSKEETGCRCRYNAFPFSLIEISMLDKEQQIRELLTRVQEALITCFHERISWDSNEWEGEPLDSWNAYWFREELYCTSLRRHVCEAADDDHHHSLCYSWIHAEIASSTDSFIQRTCSKERTCVLNVHSLRRRKCNFTRVILREEEVPSSSLSVHL